VDWEEALSEINKVKTERHIEMTTEYMLLIFG
jgi:hypothetical protein